MSFERYLSSQAGDGQWDSEGRFTINLTSAKDKLAEFALPSEHHYLLKMVQVAHRLRAFEIRVDFLDHRTRFSFTCPAASNLVEGLETSLSDPLAINQSLRKDLVVGLLGAVSREGASARLRVDEGGTRKVVELDSEGRVVGGPVDCKLSEQCRISLEVARPRDWRFWRDPTQRAEGASLLSHYCGFSSCRLFVDGSELPSSPSSVLNKHLTGFRKISLDALNQSRWRRSQVPASNILFQMADADEASFSLLRPSLSAYLVRRDRMNIWASALRPNNTLEPDGVASAAWMLQFRKGGRDVSMRQARKRDSYKAVLALNVGNEGADKPFRYQIIRNGVVVLERSAGIGFEKLEGCVLLLADEKLRTDLTGLQLIEEEALQTCLKRTELLRDEAERYFREVRRLIESGRA